MESTKTAADIVRSALLLEAERALRSAVRDYGAAAAETASAIDVYENIRRPPVDTAKLLRNVASAWPRHVGSAWYSDILDWLRGGPEGHLYDDLSTQDLGAALREQGVKSSDINARDAKSGNRMTMRGCHGFDVFAACTNPRAL